MSKPNLNNEADLKEEAFEMIELAIDDLDTLTRAFNMIEEVCNELQHPRIYIEDKPEDSKLH